MADTLLSNIQHGKFIPLAVQEKFPMYRVILGAKKIFLLAASIALLSLAGCGNAKNSDNENGGVPNGMVAADLSSHGLPILLNVPDSTIAPLEITDNAQGGVDIKVGKNIQMAIIEGPGDITLKKNDITHDDVRKFIKYVVEEPNYLVWEWQIEGQEPEFHFYAIVKDKSRSFEVYDIAGDVFSEKSVTQMLDAAKTIRIKTRAKVES